MEVQPIAVHDQRRNGLGPVWTLTQDKLVMTSKGALGGGLHTEIPVASITGFYASMTDVVSSSGRVKRRPDMFIVAWRAGDRPQITKWMAEVRTPSFRTFSATLAQLRPDADLNGLSSAEAHARLGTKSLKQVWVIAIIVTLVVMVVAVVAVIAVVAASDDGPPAPTHTPAKPVPSPATTKQK